MKAKHFISFLILGLLLVSFGLWYFQRNVFSKDVLKLEILGPEKVEVGQEVNYVLKYKNNGEITLTAAKLTFEYPEHSLVKEDKLRIEKALDDIYPGEEKAISFSARILGTENESKKAQAWLEFQPKNLKARYEVSTSQTSTIGFSPLTFEMDLPSRVEAEKDFSFSLNYFSNIDYPLSQLTAKIEYPDGFEFIQSTPQALEQNEWPLSLLNKAQGGRINVEGRIRGGVGEQKLFKASLGIWQKNEFVLLKETNKGTEIIKPNIYVSQMINGSLDYSASQGDSLHYEIFFKNIGSSPFENMFLVVRLEGAFFDFNALRVQNASYHPGDNSLIWDWKKNPQLKFLGENEEGKVDFWIDLKSGLSLDQSGKNPVLKDRVSISPASEEFTIKVGSKLALEGQTFFDDEVFGNSGPLPPQVGQPTTYTVIWRLKNFYNDLKDVKVKAVLPPQVSLTGQLFPREARFLFDSQSREIVWEAGDVAAGSGVSDEGPNLSFQISLVPESSQRGQAVEVLGTASALGDDSWTREVVTGQAGATKTNSLSDLNFNPSQGIVQ